MRSGDGFWRFGIVAFVLLFVLAACGEAADSPATSAAQSAAQSAAPDDSEAAEPSEPAIDPPGTERASVKVGFAQLILSFMPLYIADDQGFWEEENLDVELVFFNSGAEAQQALLGDAVDVGAGGYSEPIIIQSQGVDTRTFGFIQDTLPYHLMAKPEITSIDDLEGKTLGVSREGSLTDVVLRIALAKVGFDPARAEFQAAGGSPARLAALESGALDATILDAPSYLLAGEAGFVDLLDYTEELPGFPYEVLYAKGERMDADPDVYLRFMRGYIKGAMWATDPANRDEVIRISAEYLEAPEEDVALGYDTYINDFPPDGMPTEQGIRDSLEGTREFAPVPGMENVTTEDLFYPDLAEQALESLEVYP